LSEGGEKGACRNCTTTRDVKKEPAPPAPKNRLPKFLGGGRFSSKVEKNNNGGLRKRGNIVGAKREGPPPHLKPRAGGGKKRRRRSRGGEGVSLVVGSKKRCRFQAYAIEVRKRLPRKNTLSTKDHHYHLPGSSANEGRMTRKGGEREKRISGKKRSIMTLSRRNPASARREKGLSFREGKKDARLYRGWGPI